MRTLLAAAVLVAGLGVPGVPVTEPAATARPAAPVDSVEVVATWPHDRAAFTQGLLFDDGHLLESTGLYGASTLRRVELRTGRVLQQVDLGWQYFAEGIALLRGRVYQLTWRELQCFVYDSRSLARQNALTYAGEAWGLTHDGRHLILSDGTAELRFLDPATLKVERTVTVLDGGRPVRGLNELEYVDGQIYANLLGQRRIARIDPRDGTLLRWIDLTDLVAAVEVTEEGAGLNGIAYDASADRLFVTGKRWPSVFEIRVAERP